jgi:hypothetical protein
VDDTGLEEYESHGRDDVPVWLARPVTPNIVPIETTVDQLLPSRTRYMSLPHAKHIDQMLLGHIVLLAHIPLQSCKDCLSLSERFTTALLQFLELLIRQSSSDIRLGELSRLGDGKVF